MESTYFVGVKEKLFFYNFRNNIYVDRKYGQLKSQTGRNLSVYSLNPKNFSYQFFFLSVVKYCRWWTHKPKPPDNWEITNHPSDSLNCASGLDIQTNNTRNMCHIGIVPWFV